jgi:hypothetical protein
MRGRPTKLDVPMGTRLQIKTTERAAARFRERAEARGMSLGEYLDYLTTRSAIVNDLAPMGDDPSALRLAGSVGEPGPDAPPPCPHRQARQITGNSGLVIYKCVACGETVPKPGPRIEPT